MRLVFLSFACFACASALAACGGSTGSSGTAGGSATISGTVGGQGVPTTEAIGIAGTEAQGSAQVQLAGVVITNFAGACDLLQSPTHRQANATDLMLMVGAVAPSVPAGTYPIGSLAIAQYGADSATCTSTTSERAQSGSIVLTSVTSTEIQGTFDVTMTNGDHLTGSFDAPVCDVNFANLSSTNTSQLPCSS
jgi:hypothetical protein